MGMTRTGLAAVTAICLSGCGTMMHGGSQAIDVQSSPSGASIATSPITGTFTTPTVLNLERKNSYVLTFSKSGYTPASFNINHSIGTGTVLADVLLTGLVGVIVDGMTGSWYGLSPEAANVSMSRIGVGEGPAEIRVFVSKSTDGGVTITSDKAADVKVTVEKK
jgi:hypothetical protein